MSKAKLVFRKLKMKKYFSIFRISFAQEFVYRLNFIMWRFRNVVQVFLIFFLWDSIFSIPGKVVFGYDRAKILTYIFFLFVVKSLVSASRSVDVAGDISRGDLTNYLLKPVNFFKYWFTRDISSKALNFVFAIFEFVLLFILLKPTLFFQFNFIANFLFLGSLVCAIVIYFCLLMIFSSLTFWLVEQAWGLIFLLNIFIEFLGGGLFPIDILPSIFQKILYLTPFPYLYFVPIQIYLGKFGGNAINMFLMSLAWTIILIFFLRFVWTMGLKEYRAEGR